ncbi:MAG: hypothetical protein IKM30_05885 [Oscillospiraceae bacterium]|nr:hypothetical protein [Oscillospiraceae bacterium]
MKREQISETLQHINSNYIAEAFAYTKTSQPASHLTFKKWSAIAACLVVITIAGVILLPRLKNAFPQAPSDNSSVHSSIPNETVNTVSTSIGGIPRHYKSMTYSTELTAMIWKWEYKLPYEKFASVMFQNQYYSSARAISNALLGDIIGTCSGEAIDSYTNTKYNETFSVRAIQGISAEKLIAVEMDGEFYVYFADNSNLPSTFGEMMDMYKLPQTLRFHRFTQYQNYEEIEHYYLEEDAAIWQILSECRDAVLLESNDLWSFSNRSYLSFTATSEALGIYKKGFSITKDGYLQTNLLRYSTVYYIGEQAADAIFRYAAEHAETTQSEPYEFSLAGTIAKIDADSLLLDDTILCTDKSNGMLFTIMTEDIRIRRYLECKNFAVGDTVVIKFTDETISSEHPTIYGAYHIAKCQILDDTITVPE